MKQSRGGRANKSVDQIPDRIDIGYFVGKEFQNVKCSGDSEDPGMRKNLKLGGEMVGSELKFDAPQSSVSFTAKLRSIVPVDHLEIVCNGKVAKSLATDTAKESADITGTLPLQESGWCVLRAWSEKAEYPVMDNYSYATTSPVYVTVAGKRAYSRKDAEYFAAWIDRTIEITLQYPDWNSPAERDFVLKRLREARSVYQQLR